MASTYQPLLKTIAHALSIEVASTDGTVVHATLEITANESAADVDALVRPQVKYRYVVDREGFVATALYDNGLSNHLATFDRAAAEALVAQFRPGTRVTVYYNPDNPAEAYLFRGLSQAAIRALALAGILAIMTLIAAVL